MPYNANTSLYFFSTGTEQLLMWIYGGRAIPIKLTHSAGLDRSDSSTGQASMNQSKATFQVQTGRTAGPVYSYWCEVSDVGSAWKSGYR